jgi:perosamine synthetase
MDKERLKWLDEILGAKGRSRAIQLNKPYVCNAAKENVARVLDSGWIGMGPEVEAFEKEFAQYIGCKHAIAVNSGTEALRMALTARPKKGRRIVLTTPNTFVATNHVILQEGLTPVFIDIDPSTGCMDPHLLDSYANSFAEDVEAIMYVYYGGNPIHKPWIERIARQNNIYLIEDAAHACGSSFLGDRVGKDSIAGCFSFHAVKNLATGDGGMFVTSSDEIADKARKARWFGIDKSTVDRSKEGYSWEYDVEFLGYKSHMNDITAAIGRGQLTTLDRNNARRREIYGLYKQYLYGSDIKVLEVALGTESSHHLMVVLCRDARHKAEAIEKLTADEIQVGYHYKPNYLYRSFRGYAISGITGMSDFYARALSLPMHILLKDIDVKRICEVLL